MSLAHPGPLIDPLGPSADAVARPAAPPILRRIFWPTFWFAVALVLMKWAAVSRVGEFQRATPWQFITNLLAITYQDLLYALALGFLGAISLKLAGSSERARQIIWALWLTLCGVSLLYAAGSIFIFQVLRSPLTYSLVYMAGDMADMGSSINAYVTPFRLTLLAVVPVLVLVTGVLSNRLLAPRHPRAWRGLVLGAVVLGLTCAAYGRYASTRHPWDTSDDRRIIDNPHWALVGSYLTELTGRGGVRLSEDFPAEYLEDFRTVAERNGAGAQPQPLARPGHRPKNVIMIVLESVGARYLNAYGHPVDAMPNLRQELQHAVVFENAYSHIQNTANALVALNLSIYPGVSWRAITQEHPRIEGTTLAQVLKGRGYRTMYATAADNAYMNMGGFLAGRGYDEIWDAQNLRPGQLLFSWGVEDKYLFEKIHQFIEQDQGKPFFVMGWTIQNHHPYELSEGQEEVDYFTGEERYRRWDLNRYLNVLTEVDRHLAKLFALLRERGVDKDTVVVITGDHGESFGEPHNTWVHAGKVYQEDVQVPFIVWNPGLREAGTRLKTVSGHIDINPTICDLLGVELPPSWQGWSAFDPKRPPRVYLYGPTEHLLGVRQGEWKYIYNSTRGEEELYNLAEDPDEQRSRAKERPEMATELRKRLAAWVQYEQGHMRKLQGR